MNCVSCKSARIASVMAKCSDLCAFNYLDIEHDGYVPEDVGIGGGDNVAFDYCLDCGRIQGEFPIPEHVIDTVREAEDDDDEDEDEDDEDEDLEDEGDLDEDEDP